MRIHIVHFRSVSLIIVSSHPCDFSVVVLFMLFGLFEKMAKNPQFQFVTILAVHSMVLERGGPIFIFLGSGKREQKR